jgi:hypothetical protein
MYLLPPASAPRFSAHVHRVVSRTRSTPSAATGVGGPPCLLYQRLCQHLRACVPELGVWPRRPLALLVTGLLLARHSGLPRVAAQLRRVTPCAQADSIGRRLRRALAQNRKDAALVFEPVVRACLRQLQAGRWGAV